MLWHEIQKYSGVSVWLWISSILHRCPEFARGQISLWWMDKMSNVEWCCSIVQSWMCFRCITVIDGDKVFEESLDGNTGRFWISLMRWLLKFLDPIYILHSLQYCLSVVTEVWSVKVGRTFCPLRGLIGFSKDEILLQWTNGFPFEMLYEVNGEWWMCNNTNKNLHRRFIQLSGVLCLGRAEFMEMLVGSNLLLQSSFSWKLKMSCLFKH